jgi:TolB-like protein
MKTRKHIAFAGILAVFVCTGLFAQQPVVAVAPFNAISGISAADANMITRVFTIRLGNTQKVAFVDRTIVERVLQEHRFQAGDWSNAQKTAELGRALNADWIVRGELEKSGSNILITVQFYDIQTFRFMSGADLRIANVDAAYDNMDTLVNKLIETISQTVTANRTYNIGDIGPAGGFVFHDKGVFSNGWRYLEAAPVEIEFNAEWGADGQILDITNFMVGAGKQNTQILVDSLRRLGENRRAAQLCVALNFDGYTDWFLPSMEELELMYKNLKQKGLGSFGNGSYWSSNIRSRVSAWGINFKDGTELEGYKTHTHLVRAVRAF